MSKVKLPPWEWAPSSTNVLCYRYVDWTKTLMVRFISSPGTEYWYRRVPPAEYLMFHDAPSKGKWVWLNLKPNKHNGFTHPYGKPLKFTGLKMVSRP